MEDFLWKLLCPAGIDSCMFLVGAEEHGDKLLLEGLELAQHLLTRIGILTCALLEIA